MPPLTAELLGIIAVVVGLLITAVIVDPQARARRQHNRRQRHAAQGCGVCRLALVSYDRRPAGGKAARR